MIVQLVGQGLMTGGLDWILYMPGSKIPPDEPVGPVVRSDDPQGWQIVLPADGNPSNPSAVEVTVPAAAPVGLYTLWFGQRPIISHGPKQGGAVKWVGTFTVNEGGVGS